MEEQWKKIPGFSDDYEVSNFGRVRRVAGRMVRSNGRPQTFRERIIRLARDEWGYPQCRVDGKTRKVHVLVALAFIGPRPFPEAVVRHLDGNPGNNAVSNLAYGTASQNTLDGYDYRGTIRTGQKLTEKQAGEIKELLAKGVRGRDLAKAFGVSEQTVCDIKHGRIYRRVEI